MANAFPGRLDIASDAKRVFSVLNDGGLALIPGDVGYGFIARDPKALDKMFKTKKRAAHKRHGMAGSYEHHLEIHRGLDARAHEIIDTLALDYRLPFSIVAPYDPDNRFIRQLDEETLKGSTVNGTIGLVINQGNFVTEVVRLGHEAGVSLLGSSANMSGTGIKGRLEEVEPEIVAIADIVIDYGLAKYHAYKRASTLINFQTMQVIRAGACYEIIADVLKRRFGIDVPADPGLEALPSGILWEAPEPA
jgi:tRNA A37 threonylcarbamoyladenosine synthetase subunit TsaC/SUA5/YrdC